MGVILKGIRRFPCAVAEEHPISRRYNSQLIRRAVSSKTKDMFLIDSLNGFLK
jgi:hypothetical protein